MAPPTRKRKAPAAVPSTTSSDEPRPVKRQRPQVLQVKGPNGSDGKARSKANKVAEANTVTTPSSSQSKRASGKHGKEKSTDDGVLGVDGAKGVKGTRDDEMAGVCQKVESLLRQRPEDDKSNQPILDILSLVQSRADFPQAEEMELSDSCKLISVVGALRRILEQTVTKAIKEPNGVGLALDDEDEDSTPFSRIHNTIHIHCGFAAEQLLRAADLGGRQGLHVLVYLVLDFLNFTSDPPIPILKNLAGSIIYFQQLARMTTNALRDSGPTYSAYLSNALERRGTATPDVQCSQGGGPGNERAGAGGTGSECGSGSSVGQAGQEKVQGVGTKDGIVPSGHSNPSTEECNASTADLDRYSVPTSTLLQQISPGLSTPPLPPANTTALVLYSSGVHSTLSFTPTFVNGVMLPEDEARANALTKKLVRAKKAQHRPKATTKQYGPAAREYTEWSTRYYGNDIVKGDRLAKYLIEHVMEVRGKRDRKGTEKVGPATLSILNTHVKAVVDLWTNQQADRMTYTEEPHPRTDTVSSILRQAEYDKVKRDREEFADRGLHTLMDGYSTSEHEKIANLFMSRPGERNVRNRFDHLSGHNAIGRGDNRRRLQLPDLCTVELGASEGLTPCTAMVDIADQGKTNQFGKITYMSYLRNKDVNICPQGAFAAYMVARFDIGDELFPDLSEKRKWYNTYVLKGSNPQKEMSYDTQHAYISECFKTLKIRSTHKTHAVRGSGLRAAEAEGADKANLRRLGHWASEKIDGCYLTNLPLQAMRVLAGFPAEKGNFYIPRAHVTPPEELVAQVLPDVDVWLRKYEDEDDGDAPHDLASEGFLRRLHYCRILFLQDAPFLREKYPEHLLWSHPVFQHPLYKAYEDNIRSEVGKMTDGKENLTKLEANIPVIAAVIQSAEHRIQLVDAKLTTIEGKVGEVIEEVKRHRIAVGPDGTSRPDETNVPDGCDSSGAAAVPPSSPSAAKRISFLVQPGLNANKPHLLPAPSEEQLHQAETRKELSFRLDRTLRTVKEVWNEYTTGTEGRLSVQEMNRKHGAMWRSEGKEKSYYCNRKILYDEIERRTKLSNGNEGKAVTELQLLLDNLGRNGSVDQLIKLIRKMQVTDGSRKPGKGRKSK